MSNICDLSWCELYICNYKTINMKLFVTGLPSNFDEVDLKEMFELYGDVSSAKVIIDFKTKKSKGYGFAEMPNETEAQGLIAILNGKKISGKKLQISKAEERPAGEQRERRPSFGSNANRPYSPRPNNNNANRPTFRKRFEE